MPRNWTLWNDAIEKQPTQSSFKFERPGECKRRTWVQPQKAMWQRVWFLLQESNSWLTATLHLSKPNDKPYLEEKTLRMHETCFSSDLIYTNTVRCVVTISPNQLSHQAEIFCHYLFSINVASRADILRNPAQIQSATSACKQVASKTLSQVWLVKLVKSWQILSSSLGLPPGPCGIDRFEASSHTIASAHVVRLQALQCVQMLPISARGRSGHCNLRTRTPACVWTILNPIRVSASGTRSSQCFLGLFWTNKVNR